MIDKLIDEEPWKPSKFYAATSTTPHWHSIQRTLHPLHPAVKTMLNKAAPVNWQVLLLQWPYISEKDPTRLAYTASLEHGERDRQTITSVGKYLAKHWPHVPDHERRDVQALYTPDQMYFVHTTPEMVMAVELGPRSCMASISGAHDFTYSHDHQEMLAWINDESNPEPDWEIHPYASYKPEFGWHMALRKGPTGRIDGRALCFDKIYTRTYRRHLTDDDGYSETDHALSAWLDSQGYEHNEWPDGARIMPIYGNSNDINRAPYIDGQDRIEHVSGVIYRLNRDGNIQCSCTNGRAEEDDEEEENYELCHECEEQVYEDNQYYVGRTSNVCVCGSCQDNYYTGVRGHHITLPYTEYYVHNDYAAEVINCDFYIDIEYVPRNCVELYSGEYAIKDEAVRIDGEWYYIGDNGEADDRIIQLAAEFNNEEFAFKDNCWEDDVDGGWYHNDDKEHPATETDKGLQYIPPDSFTIPLFAELESTS